MDRIGVGIIGGGRIADVHAPGYLSSDQARIVAVCDRDPDTLARRVEEWDADRGYADFQELLADPNVDLVDILTPHHLHAPMVIAAAKSGKHISVQKPMAVTVAECDEMIKACKYAGVHLRVFENFIFYPPFVLAKQLVDQGEIGEPLSLRLKLGNMSGGWPVPLATWLWRFNPELAGPGPTVFDDGYHKFSMAVDLFGEIDSVHGWIDRSFGVADSPSMVSFTFKDHPALGYFESAVSLNAKMRSKYYSADERMEITGTRGTILMTRCTGRLLDEAPLLLVKDGRTIEFEDLRDDWLDSFTDCTHHYIDAIQNFRGPKLTGERGRHILQVAYAAYISAREGRRVDPNHVTGEELWEIRATEGEMPSPLDMPPPRPRSAPKPRPVTRPVARSAGPLERLKSKLPAKRPDRDDEDIDVFEDDDRPFEISDEGGFEDDDDHIKDFWEDSKS